ncbi:unnamed protein product [Schistosoma margrebowiei]|uniref:G-protein coupled receptors family 2 profile 2 domain-containing protein n=1 Tax=Schistosoma margrebowiei TaxID=48269 RepID=A0AA84ZHE7_9TREM|nr:unnamed protein product [Schistosoma margrebowiei]
MIVQNYLQNVLTQKALFLLVLSVNLILCLLKINDYIHINAWFMFMPLWLWNILVFAGSLILFLFKSLNLTKFCLFYYVYQILILTFQIFLCIKLEKNVLNWCVVFIPIYCLCVLGFLTFTKAFYELTVYDCEKFLALNLPCVILIALRLDNYINWTWVVVLIPFWIIMGFLIALLLFLVCMLCGLSRFTQKDFYDIVSMIGCTSVAFTFLIFVVLLVCRLDNIKLFTYNEIFLPLFICILFLLVMTISTNWLVSKFCGNINSSDGGNCLVGYTSGSRLSGNTLLDPIQRGNTNVANITVSRDKYSEVHQNLTKNIASEPLENNIETVISPNTEALCSNLLIKEKHFIHSNKLNEPMIKENSLSLPD